MALAPLVSLSVFLSVSVCLSDFADARTAQAQAQAKHLITSSIHAALRRRLNNNNNNTCSWLIFLRFLFVSLSLSRSFSSNCAPDGEFTCQAIVVVVAAMVSLVIVHNWVLKQSLQMFVCAA